MKIERAPNVPTFLVGNWLLAHPKDDLQRIIYDSAMGIPDEVYVRDDRGIQEELEFSVGESISYLLDDILAERSSGTVKTLGDFDLSKFSISAELDSAVFSLIGEALEEIDLETCACELLESETDFVYSLLPALRSKHIRSRERHEAAI